MPADPKPEAIVRKDLFKHLRRRDLVILGATLAHALGGLALYARVAVFQDVWLVNALSVPVTVEIGGAKTALAAGARAEVLVRDGVHRARVLTASGDVLDDAPIDVDAGQDVVVYNVLGAAPIYTAIVQYSVSPSKNGGGNITFHGGERLSSHRHIDFVFKEPPESISIKRGQSTSRTRLDLAPGGWLGSVNYLVYEAKQPGKAARLARAVARAQPDDLDAQAWARRRTEVAEGFDAAAAFLREQRALRPNDLEVHRSYQYVMRRAGHFDALRAEYRELRAKDPGSAEQAVLLARVEGQAEAQALHDEVLKAHPDHGLATLGAANLAYHTRRYADAVALYTKAASDPLYYRHAEDHAAALVALGRASEALDQLAHLGTEDAAHALSSALTYARIARLPDLERAPADPLVHLKQLTTKPGYEPLLAWNRSVLGDVTNADLKAVNDDDIQVAIQIHLAAQSDPAEAWAKCAAASGPALERLHTIYATLLAAEFARAGDRALAERILGSRVDPSLPPAILFDYVTSGADHPELWRLDPEIRSLLDLVRARALEQRGDAKAAAALYAAAEQGAPIKDILLRVRRAWPPPGAAASTPAASNDGGKPALVGSASEAPKPSGGVLGALSPSNKAALLLAAGADAKTVSGNVGTNAGKFVVLRKRPGD